MWSSLLAREGRSTRLYPPQAFRMAAVESEVTVHCETAGPLSKGQNMEPQDYVPFSMKIPTAMDRQHQAVTPGPSCFVCMVETESGNLPSCRKGEGSERT